jgi:hypothetical protein
MIGPLIARSLVIAVYAALHESAFDPKRTSSLSDGGCLLSFSKEGCALVIQDGRGWRSGGSSWLLLNLREARANW